MQQGLKAVALEIKVLLFLVIKKIAIDDCLRIVCLNQSLPLGLAGRSTSLAGIQTDIALTAK